MAVVVAAAAAGCTAVVSCSRHKATTNEHKVDGDVVVAVVVAAAAGCTAVVNAERSVLIARFRLRFCISCSRQKIIINTHKGGGEVVAKGTPEQIIKDKKSYTAKFLKKELK